MPTSLSLPIQNEYRTGSPLIPAITRAAILDDGLAPVETILVKKPLRAALNFEKQFELSSRWRVKIYFHVADSVAFDCIAVLNSA